MNAAFWITISVQIFCRTKPHPLLLPRLLFIRSHLQDWIKINVYESMGLSTADNDSHPVTVSPISQSSSYTGKDIYGLPQYAHRVRPAQHKIPKLTASKGWAGPCWSCPRAERKVVLYCPQLLSRNAHQSTSKQAACEGGPLCHMSDTGITLSGCLKDYRKGKLLFKGLL